MKKPKFLRGSKSAAETQDASAVKPPQGFEGLHAASHATRHETLKAFELDVEKRHKDRVGELRKLIDDAALSAEHAVAHAAAIVEARERELERLMLEDFYAEAEPHAKEWMRAGQPNEEASVALREAFLRFARRCQNELGANFGGNGAAIRGEPFGHALAANIVASAPHTVNALWDGVLCLTCDEGTSLLAWERAVWRLRESILRRAEGAPASPVGDYVARRFEASRWSATSISYNRAVDSIDREAREAADAEARANWAAKNARILS